MFMKRFLQKIKNGIKNADKSTLVIYIILRFLTIICLVRELMNGNIEHALLCVLALILFVLPFFVEKTFKIDLPNTLEIIIFLFIFSAEILGEIHNFYGIFHNFDSILHTINGFLAASVGFSLVYLLNENMDSLHLTPIFVSLVAFCFSMTIGIFWEFFEYGMDKYFNLDMQKDEYVYQLRTVELDPDKSNKVFFIDDVQMTILYSEDGRELIRLDGYLDIGLHDTMRDLIVNFIGAFVFSVFGYLYIVNKDKYKLAEKFLTKKVV